MTKGMGASDTAASRDRRANITAAAITMVSADCTMKMSP